MYESYWSLKAKPFENTPDPRFVYYSLEHEEALMRLLYAVRERKGAAILIGEYGSGKTIISRVLLQKLDEYRNYRVALIAYPRLDPVEFLEEILYHLGEKNLPQGKSALLRRLEELLHRNMKDGKDTVIIVDEAHMIDNLESFEELRLLLNFQLNNRFLLTLILIGQPELKNKINQLPQFKQRLSVRYHLSHLNKRESRKYIAHRLHIAGNDNFLFTYGATKLIFENSGGAPRSINNFCDMSLLVGFTKQSPKVGKRIVREVIRDLEEDFA